MNVPAKTDYMNDNDFIIDNMNEPKYYKDVFKSNKNKHKINNRAITPIQSESVLAPVTRPYRFKNNNKNISNNVDTVTGNANIIVNEISKLFDGNIDSLDSDISIKIRNNDNETKWLNVGYDVIYTLSNIIEQLIK